MDSNYLTNPLIFLVEVIFQIYILAVLLRFLLQWARADFNNSISQLIVRVTSPVLIPMRRVIPPVKGTDTASLVLAWLLKALELLLVILLGKDSFMPVLALLGAIPALIEFIINIILAVIILQAIMSWVAFDTYHPVVDILQSLSNPVLAPFRKLLPSASGFDFSPMVAVLALIMLKMLLLPPLKTLVANLVA
jgi:YggT family protein